MTEPIIIPSEELPSGTQLERIHRDLDVLLVAAEETGRHISWQLEGTGPHPHVVNGRKELLLLVIRGEAWWSGKEEVSDGEEEDCDEEEDV